MEGFITICVLLHASLEVVVGVHFICEIALGDVRQMNTVACFGVTCAFWAALLLRRRNDRTVLRADALLNLLWATYLYCILKGVITIDSEDASWAAVPSAARCAFGLASMAASFFVEPRPQPRLFEHSKWD